MPSPTVDFDTVISEDHRKYFPDRIFIDSPLGQDYDDRLRRMIVEGGDQFVEFYNKLHRQGLVASDLPKIRELQFPNGVYWNPKPIAS